jgi:ABC-type transporter Mla subunit MlaD
MPDPAELLKAWQDAVGEVGSAAASLLSRPAGVAGDLLEPLQNQAQVIERVLQSQLDFQRELLTQALAPARLALDIIDQATEAYRAQATAFRSASASFAQLADLMEQQAELIERTSAAIRDPVAALRSTAAEADSERGA